MQDDEAVIVKTLEAYKQIIFDFVKQHRGRGWTRPETTSWPSSPAWRMRCKRRLCSSMC
jgi:hypothetical protein